MVYVDADGEQLDGAHRYEMHFARAAAGRRVLVDDDVRHARVLPRREPDRALLDRRPHTRPRTGDDGSITILMQRDAPATRRRGELAADARRRLPPDPADVPAARRRSSTAASRCPRSRASTELGTISVPGGDGCREVRHDRGLEPAAVRAMASANGVSQTSWLKISTSMSPVVAGGVDGRGERREVDHAVAHHPRAEQHVGGQRGDPVAHLVGGDAALRAGAGDLRRAPAGPTRRGRCRRRRRPPTGNGRRRGRGPDRVSRRRRGRRRTSGAAARSRVSRPAPADRRQLDEGVGTRPRAPQVPSSRRGGRRRPARGPARAGGAGRGERRGLRDARRLSSSAARRAGLGHREEAAAAAG